MTHFPATTSAHSTYSPRRSPQVFRLSDTIFAVDMVPWGFHTGGWFLIIIVVPLASLRFVDWGLVSCCWY